jgi:chromosomal replication initiation ATPase DnaA
MFIVDYRATERGIRERRMHQVIPDEHLSRLAAQRAAWEAERAVRQARQDHIERIRAEASERAEAYANELKQQAGFRYRPSIAEIERRASRVFGVSRKDIHSDRRHQSVVLARQFVMYWAVRLTPLSLPQIGRIMGGKDHTTVLAGRRAYPKKRAKMGRYLRPAL